VTGGLSVVGSTGSIGLQTLEVAAHLGLRVACLAAGRNSVLLAEQARRFGVHTVALFDEAAARDLRVRLADTPVRVLSGPEGVCALAADPSADTVVTAATGLAGLAPTLAAVTAGRRVALAGKEALVCAGALVMAKARRVGCEILPVDSEHSAIFQCLQGQPPDALARLVLTASGGPFWGWDRARLAAVTPDMALRHPNWRMGPKITLDSATLMNKGLECIEASFLFGLPAARIDVVVHRQSVIHSMVTFRDGSTLAQLGAPDMRLPIQYALTWPERLPSPVSVPDWAALGALTFEAPDEETFPALALARAAAARGGTAPAVFNGAGEAAGAMFLRGEIGFLDIADRVGRALAAVPVSEEATLEAVYEADRAARRAVSEL
jgi:1-deoxy-D-xylulose-5-phosphate reductoisomerase